MRQKRRKSVGFTLIECLISIAILAIALTGVMAALAYDAFSAGQGSSYTFAVNYSRKLMDLLQSGQIDPLIYAQELSAPYDPPPVNGVPHNDGTTWHNLLGSGVGNPDDILRTGGLTTDDFWGPVGSPERLHFENEAQRFGVNFCYYRDRPGSASSIPTPERFRNQLVHLIVTTRWPVRQGFRSVQLRSFYVTSPS